MRALAATLLLCLLAPAAFAQGPADPVRAERPPLSVATSSVETGEVTGWFYAEGVAQAARKEFLQFRQAGRVIEIGQDASGRELRAGSHVEAGTVLARIDATDAETALVRAEAEERAAAERLSAAEATRDQARADFERQRSLTERGVGARAQFDAAEAADRTAQAGLMEAEANMAVARAEVAAARLQLQRTELVAPFTGVIALMNVRVGNDVGGAPADTSDEALERAAAVVLLDDRQFDVTLHLPPFDADDLAEGQRALIGANGTVLARHLRGSGVSNPVIAGEVWSLSPSITLQRRALTVVVRASGNANLLRDGGFVTVWIEAAHEPDTLRIPYDAIIQRGETYFTYVVDRDRAVRRVLDLGLAGLDHVEVLGGLTAGEQVIIRGQHRLSDGAPVRVVEGQ